MNRISILIKKHPYLVYTLLFIVTALMTFGMFLLYGKSLLSNTDGYFQHFPLLAKLRHMMGDLLRGNGFSFWLKEVSQGGDTLGNFSIVLCDPFNYIAAAFPVKYMDVGYGIAVVLRMYTAGLAMMAFMSNQKMSTRQRIIGGLSYAFCSWAVGVRIHAFFLLPLILFPLIILGINKVFEGKRPYILIFSVAASLITYVYFAYMSAVFAFIYIVVKYIFGNVEEKKSFGKFMLWVIKFTGYVLIACLISSVVLFPMTYSIINASTASGVDVHPFLNLKQALRVIPSLLSNTEIIGHYSYIGVNALLLAVFPVVLYSVRDKRTRVPAIMAIFSLVMSTIPIWGSVMNGFSYSVGRWCYMLAFFLVWVSVECIEYAEKLGRCVKKWGMIWALFLLCSLIISSVVFPAISIGYVALGCYTIVCIMLFLHIEIKREWILYIALVFQIGFFYILYFSPYFLDGMAGYLDQGAAYKSYESSLLHVTPAIDDEDFYRVDFIERIRADGTKYPYQCVPANESLYWECGTTISYLSTFGKNIHLYNEQLGNYGSYTRRTNLCGYDNRIRLNYLAGIKYYLCTENSKYDRYASFGYSDKSVIDGVTINKAKYNPGLGYVFTNAMNSKEYDKYSELEKEQILMQNIILNEDDINNKEIVGNINRIDKTEIDIENVDYIVSAKSEIKPRDNSFCIDKTSGELELEIPDIEQSEVFVQIKGLQKEPYTLSEIKKLNLSDEASAYELAKFKRNYLSYEPYENFEAFICLGNSEKRIVNASGEAQANRDMNVYTVNLGYFEKTQGNILLKFSNTGKYYYDELKIFAVPVKSFEEQAKVLEMRRFNVTNIGNNKISGTVDTDEPGVLYVNIPYSEGWSAYVDGKKTPILCADICFMGIPVSTGKHNVSIKYQPIGYPISIILSGIGISIMLIMFGADIYRCTKRKEVLHNE